MNDHLYFPLRSGKRMRFNGTYYSLAPAGSLHTLEHTYIERYKRKNASSFDKRAHMLGHVRNDTTTPFLLLLNQHYDQLHGKEFLPLESVPIATPELPSVPILPTIIDRTIYVNNNIAYSFQEAKSDNWIRDKGIFHYLHRWKHIEEIERGYQVKFASHIKVSRAKKRKLTVSKEGDSYCTTIEPYSILHKGDRYNFPRVTIAIDVKEADTISIQGPASVTTPDYLHPHIYSDGSICYNGNTRWERLDIMFGKEYSLEDGARKCAQVFYEAFNTITRYFGSVQKVRALNRDVFSEFIDQRQ